MDGAASPQYVLKTLLSAIVEDDLGAVQEALKEDSTLPLQFIRASKFYNSSGKSVLQSAQSGWIRELLQ